MLNDLRQLGGSSESDELTSAKPERLYEDLTRRAGRRNFLLSLDI